VFKIHCFIIANATRKDNRLPVLVLKVGNMVGKQGMCWMKKSIQDFVVSGKIRNGAGRKYAAS
jgi:hypothetical protein